MTAGVVVFLLLALLAVLAWLGSHDRGPNPREPLTPDQRRRVEAMRHAEAVSEIERLARIRHDRDGGFDPFADGEAVDGGTL